MRTSFLLFPRLRWWEWVLLLALVPAVWAWLKLQDLRAWLRSR